MPEGAPCIFFYLPRGTDDFLFFRMCFFFDRRQTTVIRQMPMWCRRSTRATGEPPRWIVFSIFWSRFSDSFFFIIHMCFFLLSIFFWFSAPWYSYVGCEKAYFLHYCKVTHAVVTKFVIACGRHEHTHTHPQIAGKCFLDSPTAVCALLLFCDTTCCAVRFTPHILQQRDLSSTIWYILCVIWLMRVVPSPNEMLLPFFAESPLPPPWSTLHNLTPLALPNDTPPPLHCCCSLHLPVVSLSVLVPFITFVFYIISWGPHFTDLALSLWLFPAAVMSWF